MAFKFRVLHVKDESNISECLSRHPIRSTDDDQIYRITD